MRGIFDVPARTSALWTVFAGALAVCKWTVVLVSDCALTAVCGVAFWIAVLLPLAYLPLLLAGPPGVNPVMFGQLLTVNVVALVVGQFYEGTAGRPFRWT